MSMAPIYLVVALLLVLACAVFVAAEFSLTTVERGAVERAAARGERGAAGVLRAVRALTFQLSGAQLGITVTSLVIGMLAEPAIAVLLRGPLEDMGLGTGTADTTAIVLGVVLSTVTLMVLGELVPKNWAISSPLAVAKVVQWPQRAFSAVFSPFIGHLNSTANHAVRRMGLEPAEELASARSPAELVALARHSARAGTLEADTADLFVRALTLGDLTVERIMTPRVRMHAVDAHATAADIVNLTRGTGLSRFPVYRESPDEIIGVVHLKRALAVPEEQRAGRRVTDIMRPPLLVPGTLPVDQLLARLRGDETLAVVVDEYGGTDGVATLEDIIEEVVGEVRDEHDPYELPEIRPTGRDATGRPVWDIDGRFRLDQLRRLGMPAPDGPYETAAGLVAHRLARIPRTGDSVGVGEWELLVTEVERHHAHRLRLTGPATPDRLADGAR